MTDRMDCREAQDRILEELAEPLTGEGRRATELHVASCSECTRFAETHRELDARLGALLIAPQLGRDFRPALRKKLAPQRSTVWPDYLPDIAHVAGCGCAVVLSAVLVPQYSGTVLAAGAGLTVATYCLQSALRMVLETLDEDA